MSLEYYIKKFQKLRRDHKNGGAPHKPILLLSLIEHFEDGLIQFNRIYITPELIGSFKSNWSYLVTTQHDPRFALPFYHLKGDKFWHLMPNIGFEQIIQLKGMMRNLKSLDDAIAYVTLDDALYLILLQPLARLELKKTILDTYFPSTKHLYLNTNKKYQEEILSLESTFLEDTSVEYIQAFKQNTDDEDKFKRGAVFKRLIPQIYNFTCCISGLKIVVTRDIQMIDACHIKQFSETRDDTISNGFALCPNLHRAFDRGLIGIDNNYKVIISDAFTEETFHPFGIKQLKGKKILLPSNKKYYPNIDNFEWHRDNKFLY